MFQRLHRRYFAWLLFPSLIILILTFIAFFHAQNTNLSAMQTNARKNNQQATTIMAESIGSLIQQTKLHATNLASQAGKLNVTEAEQFKLYTATIEQMLLTQLNSESLFNTVIDRCYLFLFDKNILINHTSTTNKADDYYRAYFSINGLSYDEFCAQYTQHYYRSELIPQVSINYLGTEYDRWMIVQSIPINSTQKPTGVLIFLLDNSTLIAQMRQTHLSESSLCLMIADDGSYLVSQGRDNVWSKDQIEQLLQLSAAGHDITDFTGNDKIDYVVSTATAENVRFISVQPASILFGNVRAFNFNTILQIFAVFLFSMLFALFCSGYQTNSIKQVLNHIGALNFPQDATNVYSYIQKAFDNTREKEKLLSERIDQQKSTLQKIFLHRLLQGEWATESDLIREQHAAGLNLDAAAYVVLLFYFWQAPVTGQLLRKTLEEEFGQQFYLIQTNEHQFSCLLLAEEPDLRESIEAVTEKVNHQIQVTTLVSCTATNQLSIAESYHQVQAMSHLLHGGELLLWYDDLFQDNLPSASEGTMYTENILRNNIIAGHEEAVTKYLDEMYHTNMRNNISAKHTLQFFAYDLYRMVNQLEIENFPTEHRSELNELHLLLEATMTDTRNFEQFYDQLRSHCLYLCRYYQSKLSCADHATTQQILQYIDTHFMDATLSLDSIADVFGFSSKYLSYYFKAQTGKKLSSYIESIRIAHACTLLQNTEMTINEIAKASGYSLPHTFRVAFKKIHGVTPLEWKKSLDSQKTL